MTHFSLFRVFTTIYYDFDFLAAVHHPGDPLGGGAELFATTAADSSVVGEEVEAPAAMERYISSFPLRTVKRKKVIILGKISKNIEGKKNDTL